MEIVERSEAVRIKTLKDLVDLNIRTLEEVVSGETDNRKAAVIFTGSRTVTGALKLGLEAMKLGIPEVGGLGMVDVPELPGPKKKKNKQ